MSLLLIAALYASVVFGLALYEHYVTAPRLRAKHQPTEENDNH